MRKAHILTCASKDYLKYRPHVINSGVIMIAILHPLIIFDTS